MKVFSWNISGLKEGLVDVHNIIEKQQPDIPVLSKTRSRIDVDMIKSNWMKAIVYLVEPKPGKKGIENRGHGNHHQARGDGNSQTYHRRLR